MARIFITPLLVVICVVCNGRTTTTANEGYPELVAEPHTVNKTPNSCTRFPFRWLEIENVLYSSKVRHIEIFLDEKAFSEANLRRLFEHVSEQNPEPKHITALVYTNWAQLQYPAPGCPGIGMSNMPEKLDRYDYHQAIYYRRETVEYFRYSPALKVHEADFKMVVIRGKRIQPTSQK